MPVVQPVKEIYNNDTPIETLENIIEMVEQERAPDLDTYA